MSEGITKKELEDKKVLLTEDIKTAEDEEALNNAQVITSTAQKLKLRAKVVSLKNDLVLVDKLIDECKPIIGSL